MAAGSNREFDSTGQASGERERSSQSATTRIGRDTVSGLGMRHRPADRTLLLPFERLKRKGARSYRFATSYPVSG